MQTTEANRTKEGAYLQLKGLYEEKEEGIDKEGILELMKSGKYKVLSIPNKQDFLLHVDQKNCPRYSSALDFVRFSPQYAQITSFFPTHYSSLIEALVDWKVEDYKEMKKVCSYLYWANLNEIPLKKTMGEKEIRVCEAVGHAKIYCDAMGK